MNHLPKILIVEDDLDILSMMLFLFRKKGYTVTAISKAEEAFKQIEHFLPDIILLDVFLSGADGRNICQQLKKQKGTKHIPVIMISANPEAADNMHLYGADDFIHKPFEINDLLSRINSLFA